MIRRVKMEVRGGMSNVALIIFTCIVCLNKITNSPLVHFRKTGCSEHSFPADIVSYEVTSLETLLYLWVMLLLLSPSGGAYDTVKATAWRILQLRTKDKWRLPKTSDRGNSSISRMPGCGPNALPKNWI